MNESKFQLRDLSGDNIKQVIKSTFLPYALSFFGAFVLCFYFFDFPFSLNNNFIWEADGLLVQAHIQSIIDSGIFGKTDHLGYPYGFTQWNNPEISYLHALMIWISSKVLPITTYGYLILIAFTTIILNSILFFHLSVQITKNRILNLLFLLFGLLIPYSLYSLDHPHVITFYIYIAIIIALLRIDNLNLKTIILLFIILLATNMFQLILITFIFSILAALYLLYYLFTRENKLQINNLLKIYLTILIVFIANFINFLTYSSISGQNGRAAYHSDLFAGKLTDVLLSSPFINQIIPNLEILKTGGTDARFIGLPLSVFFLLVIVLLILYPVLKVELFSIKLLFSFLLISLLTFITGGFGNLQASFFVIFGQISPMRSWSRLSILIGILSFVLIFLFLQQKLKTIYLYSVMAFVLFFSVLDLTQLEKDSNFSPNIEKLEETKFLNFVDSNLEPCSILQLPIDTYFIPQGAVDQAWRYYWNGMIPYIVLPDFKWNSAVYVDSPGWNELKKIPTVIDKSFFDTIGKDYCAVVFDKNFSQYQIDRQATLSSTPGIWPGLKIGKDLIADFEDTRFSVYLLK